MLKVKLIEHTPNPEKVIAAAAKLCYSSADIDSLFDGLDGHIAQAIFAIPAVKGIEFGVAKDVKFSLYGPAFKNKENRYIALAADGQSYDVTGLTIDELNSMNYMFPTAAADIVKGDYVRHNGEWVKVLDKSEDNSLKVLKMSSNEEATVHPIKNLFGFNYYTKLLTVCGEMTGTPDEKNPFGNILPLMMLSDKNDGNKMLPLMFLMNQGGEMKMDMNNPLFLMALMK